MIEKLLKSKNGKPINDYKLMCFNGKAKCTFVCSDRFANEGLKITIFDREWNRLPFERNCQSSSVMIKKPTNYSKMIELAEKSSNNIPFVRIDFYEIDDKIYFSEITFFQEVDM